MSESRSLLVKLVRNEAEEAHHSVSVISERIRAQHPDLVDDWLDEHRDLLFTGWVSDVLRWDRSTERKRTPMEEVAERAASGLSLYDLSFVVDEDHTRKPLGEMTGPDHLFVSESYRQDSRRFSVYADLHRDLADKVGRKLTRNALAETELRDMFAKYEERI